MKIHILSLRVKLVLAGGIFSPGLVCDGASAVGVDSAAAELVVLSGFTRAVPTKTLTI